MKTERELHVKALVDRPADKLSKIKVKTLVYTLGHVYCTRRRTRFRKCRLKVLLTH